MTEQEWPLFEDEEHDEDAVEELYGELTAAPARPLFLLGAACLRRVWGRLREGVRGGVEATERYAAGRATVGELLRAWEGAREWGREDEVWMGPDWQGDCPDIRCEPETMCLTCTHWEREFDARKDFEGPRQALRNPAWFAATAAALAARLAGGAAARCEERRAQFRLYADVVAAPLPARRRARLRACCTGEALRLLRVLDREIDPVGLAVLADALEEAGCEEAALLAHLRGPGPHARGCWALEELTGRAAIALPIDDAVLCAYTSDAW